MILAGHGNAPCGQRNDISSLAASRQLHLEAANLSPKTIRTYMDSAGLLRAHLILTGMSTAAEAIACDQRGRTNSNWPPLTLAKRQGASSAPPEKRVCAGQWVFRFDRHFRC